MDVRALRMEIRAHISDRMKDAESEQQQQRDDGLGDTIEVDRQPDEQTPGDEHPYRKQPSDEHPDGQTPSEERPDGQTPGEGFNASREEQKVEDTNLVLSIKDAILRNVEAHTPHRVLCIVWIVWCIVWRLTLLIVYCVFHCLVVSEIHHLVL